MKLPVPVYGAVPPVADTVTVVVPPLHRMLPDVDEATMAAAGCVMVTVTEVEQLLASVTVYVYVPALKLLIVPVPVYGAVPPVALMVTLPLLPPKQLTLVCVKLAANTAGWVTLPEVTEVHPLASVTV